MTPYRRIALGRIVDDTAKRDVPLGSVDAVQVFEGTASNLGRRNRWWVLLLRRLIV